MVGGFFDESLEQSQIKTEIVAKYFPTWARVIGSVSSRGDSRGGQVPTRLAYMDLFAGPGRYLDGTESTPLRILRQAIDNPDLSQRLVTVFNDGDADTSRSLETAIATLPGIEKLKHRPVVHNQDVGIEMVRQFEKMKLVPTFFFVDPWGYKGLSLKLVNSVVKDWACEAVFFFNYNRISMGLGNPLVEDHMNALFGEETDALRARIASFSPADRELTIVEWLSNALNPDGRRFVLPFRFRKISGRTSHHLIHVTKHFRGYDIMKDVMAKECSVTEQGVPSFEYSPADERFPTLFELNRPLDDLEGMLKAEFMGRTIPFSQLYEEHSVGRRYVRRNYKDALLKLESAGAIRAVKPGAGSRRAGTFADDLVVSFT